MNPKEKKISIEHRIWPSFAHCISLRENLRANQQRTLSAKGGSSVGLVEEGEAKCCGNLHVCPELEGK